jgi:sugar-specific transcriptional regulator TrmB
MAEEEKINLLKDLGFTEYEAKIYLALLYLKKADTRTIAKETKIPQTKAYQVAKKLIERGFLKIVAGHPIMFEVVEPSIAFSKPLEELEKKSENARKVIAELQEEFQKTQKLGEEEIATYMNFEVLKKELKKLHDSAKNEICMYSRFEKVDEELIESLGKAVKRKVNVKVVGAVKDQTSELNAYTYKKVGCLVKTLSSKDYAPISFSLVDEEKGHFLIRSENNPNNYMDMVIKNKNLVKMFRNLFDYYWKKGKLLQ